MNANEELIVNRNRRTVPGTALAAMLAALSGAFVLAAVAQQATERYIPIGESPGVSSYIGEIVAVDHAQRILTIATNENRYTLRVTNATRIWEDRSAAARSNTNARFADCEAGDRAEVSYSPENPAVAEWIKVAGD